MICIDATAI